MSHTSTSQVDLADVQGNIVRGYNLPVARHDVLRVDDARLAGSALGKVVAEVTDSRDWESTKPESTVNISFTYRGLEALDLPTESLASFPTAFVMGMKERASLLGDTGPSAPASWDEPGKANDVHVLISMHA